MNNQIDRRYASFEVDETKNRRKPKNSKGGALIVIIRILISFILSFVLIFSLAWTWLFTIANGPSEDMKREFVSKSYEAGAEWLPALVLPANEIEDILGKAGN